MGTAVRRVLLDPMLLTMPVSDSVTVAPVDSRMVNALDEALIELRRSRFALETITGDVDPETIGQGV